MGFFSVTNPKSVSRKFFRRLVVSVLLSFLYDFIFLAFLHDSEESDEINN